MKKAHLFFLIQMLAIATFGGAQEEPVLVVSAAKVEQDIRDTVEAVEVVTREAIEESGAKNVGEVLESIPGVVIFDHPQATVMMQGFEGAYVKVLIDGMEVTGDVGGATPVSMIPVSDIERIEIIRGASSVLYGSDAMGGVINIITKKPEKDTFSFGTRQEISSNTRYYGEASLGYDNRYFGLSLMGSFDRDPGKTVTEKNNMGDYIDLYEMAAVRLSNARGSLVWHHGSGDLEAFGGWSDSLLNVSADIDNGYDFANRKREGGLKGSFGFSDRALLDGFFAYRQLNYDADWHNHVFNTTSVYAESIFRDMEGELRFSWDPSISHSLLFGTNVKREALESDAFFGEKTQVMLAAFVQDTWNIGAADRFRVTGGFRFDYRPPDSSGEDHLFKLSPKLSLRFDPTEDLILRLSYGMGFKTPSLKQNYWVFFHPAPNNFLLTGNPNLTPETSHGFNASADYQATKTFSAHVGGYFNYIFDLIDDYQSDPNPGSALNSSGTMQPYIHTRSYRNVGKAITTGGELSLRYNGARLKLSGAYTLTVAKGYDETKDAYADLPSMVPHQLVLSAGYTVPVIETGLQSRITWNAPQLAAAGMGSSGSGDTHTPDYLMVNLRVSKFFF
ncbi:MAG: TonB-dependent receptor, partial [Treponema sp.]|nr:TonB-dependent receptor [Treponema sp.]